LTPPFLHAQMAVKAAEAGKHVLVEKPMCTTLREADEVIDAARRAGVKLMVAESYVFLTAHMEARRLIESGAIGEPVQVREVKGTWLPRPLSLRLPPTDIPWRDDPARSGGGPYPWVMDHFPHIFATARYFMEDRDIEKVYSLTSTRKSRKEATGLLGRDVVVVCWEYVGGGKQGVWARIDESLDAFDHLGFRTVVNGTQGSIQVLGEGGGPALSGVKTPPIMVEKPNETLALRIDEGPDRVWVSEVNYYDRAHRNEIEHFITCVLEDREPRYTGEDGRKEIQATLAAIMSAMEDKPIRLASIPREWSAYSQSH
ncbi:MAG: Gfo/Idh/MocA family oxidoreductase, partial [Candidatus Bathyarchaeia archaeon]